MSTLAAFGCMLFFRAAARPERVSSIFRLVDDAVITLCMSPEILAEIRDVLNRPEHRVRFPALTSQAVDEFLARYLRTARWFAQVPTAYNLRRDPKDSKYVDLAVHTEAPYLITFDRDLLDLKDTATKEGTEFIHQFPKLRILDPVAFLNDLRGLRP